MKPIFNYIDRPSPIHRLTGATKLCCLLLWSFAAMLTFDTRLLAAARGAELRVLRLSKIRHVGHQLFAEVDDRFHAPQQPCAVSVLSAVRRGAFTAQSHVLFGSGRWVVTKEQLFYHLNLVLKYLAMVPVVLLFVCTTQPSEFAASLNRIGVKYTVAYSVALALRYIPDIQQEYHEISQAQQARGIEMSKKESLLRRLKAASAILIPLILSSMDRIEVISNAMELRGFGKNKRRSWYMARPFRPADFVAMGLCALLLAAAIFLNIHNGTRFWNPFI